MTQGQIRQTIMQLVHGNLRYCTPNDPICMDRVKEPENKGKEGYTIQSAEEVLNDIISDLTALEDELMIESSFQSAEL
tara:strand:+ start:1244 stop:1477 length:234 start_codon:yes stop_codon:yes gene_type:complete